jgi:hypothetical protein
MSKLSEYDVTKNMLSQIKTMNVKPSRKRKLNEDSDKGGDDAIAITNDPKFGQNVLRNQIASFKQAVHGGAKFSQENSENPKYPCGPVNARSLHWCPRPAEIFWPRESFPMVDFCLKNALFQ